MGPSTEKRQGYAQAQGQEQVFVWWEAALQSFLSGLQAPCYDLLNV